MTELSKTGKHLSDFAFGCNDGKVYLSHKIADVRLSSEIPEDEKNISRSLQIQ